MPTGLGDLHPRSSPPNSDPPVNDYKEWLKEKSRGGSIGRIQRDSLHYEVSDSLWELKTFETMDERSSKTGAEIVGFMIMWGQMLGEMGV